MATLSHSRKRSRIAADGGASGDIAEVDDSSLQNHNEAVANVDINLTSTTTISANDFSSDIVANILSYLKLREIMCKRRVCKKWTEAVRKTAVSPEEEFEVNTVKTYNAVSVMSTVLPNLQSVRIRSFMHIFEDGSGMSDDNHKYNDGEDPDEEVAAITANNITHDIEIFANFRKLRRLEINYAPLNGRYPFLFNSFPFLQKLSIRSCLYSNGSYGIKWDLGVLTGLPMLKELDCNCNDCLTGNISSLRVLKDTLEKVTFNNCDNVEGNFMDLADFSQLKTLHLSNNTHIIVDIGKIGSDDFPKVEELSFGKSNSNSVSGSIRSLRVLKNTLQTLVLDECPNVDGNFMALADFPHLKTLELRETAVTVDIGDLLNGDFSRLEDLVCAGFNMSLVSGNIRNLRVLKDTLENVELTHSDDVEGDIMDLADFSRLRTLDLGYTAVTGDIRDIGADHFSKLDDLCLPSTIYGGDDYELQRISDAPELMRALYLLKKHHPSLVSEDWVGNLSEDSPDWYWYDYDWDEEMDENGVRPPFCVSLVVAGTRIGYRWKDEIGKERCEVNWLDPEPDKDSSDYGKYIAELQEIENKVDFFKGYHQPPTQEEYKRLVQEWLLRRERERSGDFLPRNASTS